MTLDQLPKTGLGNPYFGNGVYMTRESGGWYIRGAGDNNAWVEKTAAAISYGMKIAKLM